MSDYHLEGTKQSLVIIFGIGIPFPVAIVTFIMIFGYFPSLVIALATMLMFVLSGWFAYHVIKKIAVRHYDIFVQSSVVNIRMHGFRVRRDWKFTFDQIKHYRVFRYNGTVVDIWLQNGQQIKIVVSDTFNEERDLEPFIEHLAQGVEQYHPQAADTRKASFLEKPVALFAGGIVTVAYLVFAVLWMAKMITIDNSGSLLIAFSIILTYWLGVIRSRMDAEKDARSGY